MISMDVCTTAVLKFDRVTYGRIHTAEEYLHNRSLGRVDSSEYCRCSHELLSNVVNRAHYSRKQLNFPPSFIACSIFRWRITASARSNTGLRDSTLGVLLWESKRLS